MSHAQVDRPDTVSEACVTATTSSSGYQYENLAYSLYGCWFYDGSSVSSYVSGPTCSTNAANDGKPGHTYSNLLWSDHYQNGNGDVVFRCHWVVGTYGNGNSWSPVTQYMDAYWTGGYSTHMSSP